MTSPALGRKDEPEKALVIACEKSPLTHDEDVDVPVAGVAVVVGAALAEVTALAVDELPTDPNSEDGTLMRVLPYAASIETESLSRIVGAPASLLHRRQRELPSRTRSYCS